MWYRVCKQKVKDDFKSEPIGFEEKIMRSDAENAVRNTLYYKGQYNPEQTQVNAYVNRVISRLKKEFFNLNTVRNSVNDGELLPRVKEEVLKIVK